MSVMVQARIDPKVKEEAAEVLADMGLSISDAVRLMLVRTAKEKTLPFEVWRPNAETRAAMAELEAGLGEPVTLEEIRNIINEVD